MCAASDYVPCLSRNVAGKTRQMPGRLRAVLVEFHRGLRRPRSSLLRARREPIRRVRELREGKRTGSRITGGS